MESMESQATSQGTSEHEYAKAIIEDFESKHFGYSTYSKTRFELVLVALGERDACLVHVFDTHRKDLFEQLLDYVELYYVSEPIRDGTAYRIYVANDESHLNQTTPVDPQTHLGTFLGYPKEDVEWFTKTENPHKTFKEDFPRDELGYSLAEYKRKTWLLSYLPEPTPERIENAVQLQNQYENAIHSIDYEGLQRCFKRTRNREVGTLPIVTKELLRRLVILSPLRVFTRV